MIRWTEHCIYPTHNFSQCGKCEFVYAKVSNCVYISKHLSIIIYHLFEKKNILLKCLKLSKYIEMKCLYRCRFEICLRSFSQLFSFFSSHFFQRMLWTFLCTEKILLPEPHKIGPVQISFQNERYIKIWAVCQSIFLP